MNASPASISEPAINPRVLAQAVGQALSRPNASVAEWHIGPALPAPTFPLTASLVRLAGTARDGQHTLDWALFVKTIQSFAHAPILQAVPPEMRDQVVRSFPWRTEAEVYSSELPGVLPAGLRMPVVHVIEELGDDRIRLWMEDVTVTAATWDLDRYARAARLLGRLAGRFPEGHLPAGVPARVEVPRVYFEGRIVNDVLPRLRDDALWAEPHIAETVDASLREDLMALAAEGPAILDALDAIPRYFAHGDACPQNLLIDPDDRANLVAVDWGLAGLRPVGSDLGQLLAGRAESGELDPTQLSAIDEAIVPAYLEGLREEGGVATEAETRFGYVGSMLLRSAFTALPRELLAVPRPADLRELFARRAGYARFLVDLRDAKPTQGAKEAGGDRRLTNTRG